jgi:hypothetical protein
LDYILNILGGNVQMGDQSEFTPTAEQDSLRFTMGLQRF